MSFSSSIWEGTFEQEKAKVAKLKSFYEKKMTEKGVTGKWLTLSTSKKPGEAIVKAIAEYKPVLAVMGARGISSFRKTLIGSVSDYVLHHATVPVIICKHHH
ncbi:hypothetical protein CAPTEDRAFT_192836 [Capitella teleta]|uniref:UspA domain-containing protein n=1 Tax=Capitella teleta TaxID=283909 RepID=R7VKT3_CAPTE|nr:hypothetical protein CAPTEDRAFT_192836 [Capitella teleta]|eukprot:ELU17646.1 hypothetical protein CAPTEDRAFT_192836 [Capitella teleta]